MTFFHAAIFLPLLGSLLAGFFGKSLGEKPTFIITIACMLGALASSIAVFMQVAVAGNPTTLSLFTWLNSGTFQAEWALRFDTLSAVMLLVVNGVSSMVHIYSVGYMSHDKSKQRFMCYLSLFTFMMLMLVTADNFVQLFFGWEGVGLASYLLIGFWFEKNSANAASMKAFIVNRVGDFGLVLGIFAVFVIFGSVSFDTVFAAAADKKEHYLSFLGMEIHALTLICLLLFIGAIGKSAQLGLHTWLPDAMEGPTPVSALIHAATMVTAGVFLLCRISPILEYAPTAQHVITIVGAATAIFAATVGLVQNDIKRVIAYSTCSQLGYMVFAAGVSAYGAAMFHLFTHAFFKALLFLGAGSVIHAMSDEQDLRKMGGLAKLIPLTCLMMYLGSLALAGIPPFAGYYSKDLILEAAYASTMPLGQYVFWLGCLAAFLTALYSWRLLVMTFHGKPRADEKVLAHVHESPAVMTLPLVVLAFGAVASGFLAYDSFVGHHYLDFWNGSIFVLPENDTVAAAHDVALWVKLLPIAIAVAGILAGYVLYANNAALPKLAAAKMGVLYRFLLNKWYFDELYNALFVRPAAFLGRVFWQAGDVGVIDRLGPNGFAWLAQKAGGLSSKAQTGFVFHYAFAMLLGVALLVSWYFYSFYR